MIQIAAAKRAVRIAPPEETWDALPIGLCVVNERMEAVQMNAAMSRIVPFAPALPVDVASAVEQAVERVMASGRMEENIRAVSHRGGDVRHLLITVFPLQHDGAIAAGLAVRDVTKVPAPPDAMPARCSEVVQRLAGGIAHDFNNLLTVILANAALIAETPSETRNTARFAREIVAASERAAKLTRQMLAFSGNAPVYKIRMRLDDVVQSVAPRLRAALADNVELRVYLDDGLPPIQADPAQIGDLVDILFSNALEAIGDRPGGRIIIEADRHGDRVRLRVRDNGCGIENDVLLRIFDPFFTTKFPGRGLGLAAGKGVVAAHGGTIRIESARGAGTTATVLLPI